MFSTVVDIICTVEDVKYCGDNISAVRGYHSVLLRVFTIVKDVQ